MTKTSEHIERTIRACALELHPSGELQRLAKEMGVTPKVFRSWWTKGRVPKVKADWLEQRFSAIATASTLIG
jgi:hypothetical protein